MLMCLLQCAGLRSLLLGGIAGKEITNLTKLVGWLFYGCIMIVCAIEAIKYYRKMCKEKELTMYANQRE